MPIRDLTRGLRRGLNKGVQLGLNKAAELLPEIIRFTQRLQDGRFSTALGETETRGGAPDSLHTESTDTKDSASLNSATDQRGSNTERGSITDDASLTERTPTAKHGSQEPIVTRSMARLLAGQGNYDRALSIYAALLEAAEQEDTLSGDSVNTEDLGREMNELQARMAAQKDAIKLENSATRDANYDTGNLNSREIRISTVNSDNSPSKHIAAVDDDAIKTKDEVYLQELESGNWRLRWDVKESSLDQTRALLGAEGDLVARAVVLCGDPQSQTGVRSQTHEKHNIDQNGEWMIEAIPAGARVNASIGLIHGKHFLSAAHATTRSS